MGPLRQPTGFNLTTITQYGLHCQSGCAFFALLRVGTSQQLVRLHTAISAHGQFSGWITISAVQRVDQVHTIRMSDFSGW